MRGSPEGTGTNSAVSHYGQIFICRIREFWEGRLFLSWIPQLPTVLAILLVTVKDTRQKHLGEEGFWSLVVERPHTLGQNTLALGACGAGGEQEARDQK